MRQLLPKLAWGLAAVAVIAAIAPDASGAARRASAKRTKVEAPQCPTTGTHAVMFAKAVSGSIFATADGKQVRLAGVLAPGDGGEPLHSTQAEAARAALGALLQSGPVTLAAEADVPDRYGRMQAQVFAGDAWVQGSLLRAGELRMAPDLASAVCAKQLMAAENDARLQQMGRWKEGVFTLLTPVQLGNRTGTFQLIEGKVETAAVSKGRAYINFGTDYRTDFTVTISPQDMKLFRQARFDVRKLAGQRVRVRGWLEFYNGPEIEITNPAAIEIVN